MTHKKIICSVLALILLLSFCACSKPRLFTSEKLEVEVKGEGSKTLTLKCMGPSTSLYVCEASLPELEEPIIAIKSSKANEDTFKLKVQGLAKGQGSLLVTYTDGDLYALANVTVTVDEKLKVTVSDIVFSGDDYEVSLGEGLPEGSTISLGESSSKVLKLPSAEGPWFVERYDSDFIAVEEDGYSSESQSYEFLVSAVANGKGSVYLVNNYEKQRICLDFTVSTVVDGGSEATRLELTGSSISAYDVTQSEKYMEETEGILADIRKFSSKTFVPASSRIIDCGSDDGYLDISLEMDGEELEYLVFKDITLETELSEFKKAFPTAETDSFETNGVNVTIYQIEDYSAAIWEKDGLLCELYIFEESNIIKAGDMVELFLGDTAL